MRDRPVSYPPTASGWFKVSSTVPLAFSLTQAFGSKEVLNNTMRVCRGSRTVFVRKRQLRG